MLQLLRISHTRLTRGASPEHYSMQMLLRQRLSLHGVGQRDDTVCHDPTQALRESHLLQQGYCFGRCGLNKAPQFANRRLLLSDRPMGPIPGTAQVSTITKSQPN